MSTDALAGVGARFLRENDDSSGEYTAIANIRRIRRTGKRRDNLEATDLDSTGGYREWITGFRDGGTFELETYWTPTNDTIFNDDFDDDDPHGYGVEFPDAGDYTRHFDGYVTEMGNVDITADGVLMMPVMIKVTGADTITT